MTHWHFWCQQSKQSIHCLSLNQPLLSSLFLVNTTFSHPGRKMCCNLRYLHLPNSLYSISFKIVKDSHYIFLISTLFKNLQWSRTACWWRASAHPVFAFHLSIGSPNQHGLPKCAPTKLATALFSNTCRAFLPPCSASCCSWYLNSSNTHEVFPDLLTYHLMRLPKFLLYSLFWSVCLTSWSSL